MDFSNFYAGSEFEAHEFFGAHLEADGAVFRTYAPSAKAVSLIGEFSGWQEIPMNRITEGPYWECSAREARHGQMYKFRIYHRDGTYVDHADPFAFYSELRPDTASILYDRKRYSFRDEEWMKGRNDAKQKPLNIYEMHLGSWRRKDSLGEKAETTVWEAPKDAKDGWYTYAEIADLLIPWLKENAYNYVEFMPLSEYPADESWGYQATGFFSATARYGEPDGLKYLVDRLHGEGIGVILDVVTVHFAANDYGLMQYDGTALFEYPHPAVGRSEWGSCNFMHAHGEIRSFLQSACYFWLKEYHFDGLRFDAVGNLLYWQGDTSRGENRDAIQFLRTMNSGLKARFPEVMLIAEDSTTFPKVTKPVWEGGLGFDYKWDLGWMNDTLSYFEEMPQKRDSIYHKLTFSMQYFYDENYLLPLSHDEVVHGKASILQKMANFYEGKFPQARAMYLYMYMHPGKKLNFMGNEIGQLREWDERREQDWFLQKYPLHDSFHRFIVELNRLYLEHPCLWKHDYDHSGFEWIEADDDADCVYAFRRRSEEESILCAFNFSGEERRLHFRPGWEGRWTLLMDTDFDKYSGSTREQKTELIIKAAETKEILLPAFSGRCYQESGI